jgi:hypothetical protein
MIPPRGLNTTGPFPTISRPGAAARTALLVQARGGRWLRAILVQSRPGAVDEKVDERAVALVASPTKPPPSPVKTAQAARRALEEIEKEKKWRT